jgi:hypothetical protein
MATLDDLFAVLNRAQTDPGEARPTSLRLPAEIHAAATVATELGMDPSLTAATGQALLERVHQFARQQALAGHFATYPADRPSLAAVVSRRVDGTGHPAAARPDLVADVAGWLEAREPDLMPTGRVDEAVDRVLAHVELLAAGVGRAGAG